MVTRPAAQGFACLQALRSLGVRLALSGFGAGPSSLACLWRFPFDQLRINGNAPQGLDTAQRGDLFVRSIVQLAHSLSVQVIALDVQTAAQRSALHDHGCDGLQGPLLGPPVPRDRLPHREAEIVAVVVPEGMAA
jgi:EAL domain-containing protein (putative c-di-GMP-specific phosphodiesterase class I)